MTTTTTSGCSWTMRIRAWERAESPLDVRTFVCVSMCDPKTREPRPNRYYAQANRWNAESRKSIRTHWLAESAEELVGKMLDTGEVL